MEHVSAVLWTFQVVTCQASSRYSLVFTAKEKEGEVKQEQGGKEFGIGVERIGDHQKKGQPRGNLPDPKAPDTEGGLGLLSKERKSRGGGRSESETLQRGKELLTYPGGKGRVIAHGKSSLNSARGLLKRPYCKGFTTGKGSTPE